MFKFTQFENKFVFHNENLAVVFHSPNITFNGEYKVENIEFFDYRISVYENLWNPTNYKNEWKEILNMFGEDLPIAGKNCGLLTEAINYKEQDDYIAETFPNGNVVHKQYINYQSIDGENWIIQKNTWYYSDEFKRSLGSDFNSLKKVDYSVTFGEESHKCYYKNIVIEFLTEEELLELKKTANAFFNFAINNYEKLLVQLY